MEQELHNQYSRLLPSDERLQYQLIHEYPLAGKPPMMTHIFENKEQERIIAAKGAPEAIVAVSNLLPNEKERILNIVQELASKGYRILGVAESTTKQPSFPTTQQEIPFEFIGLLAFYDPPKENIRQVLQQFNRAGIQVKILTGDNPVTTGEIARQVELPEYESVILGDEIMQLEGKELHEAVEKNQLFARMFPEAKLKVIQTLQALGHVVAMTGDGVNDGPALKAAHIGIAMGKKGTELAQQAASLILPNDDLSGMLEAVAMGRKIYTNLKKAIRYIISIHIPIVLLVFIPLALGWIYPNIFSPIHVIFFELIMGPTCSIIYENEPAEANILLHPPRKKSMHIFNLSEISVSILQGLVITMGCLLMYQWGVKHQMGEDATRTLVFTTLILSNIFLTLENRSFRFSIIHTLFFTNRLLVIIIGITTLLSAIILLVSPIRQFFKLDSISACNLALCLLTALLSVIWLEVPKWIQRSQKTE
jgi:Ca2+-transporting ATPase